MRFALQFAFVVGDTIHGPDLNDVGMSILLAKRIELIASVAIFSGVWETPYCNVALIFSFFIAVKAW
jgi:hypothetical protein